MTDNDSFWGFDPSCKAGNWWSIERSVLRRLYSTFAGGLPGTGLLLMRLVLGASLLLRAGSTVWSGLPINTTLTSLFLAGFGLLLIPGLWTPIVGALVALLETCQIMTIAGDRWVTVLLGTIGCALAMLGPGLWSVDARLFWVEARGTFIAQIQLQLLKDCSLQ